ncbi:MAG TPA: hypothetical protein PKY05_14875 [Fibrobacteria bacterium]|nr:hypothetical protein [Fibrobacteria bacterium]
MMSPMFGGISEGIETAAWILSLPFWVLDIGLFLVGWMVWRKWKDRF